MIVFNTMYVAQRNAINYYLNEQKKKKISCPHCGFHNLPENKICNYCKKPLDK